LRQRTNLSAEATTKTYFSIQKRINIASNLQFFEEKYFLAIAECNLCEIDAYRF